MKPLFSLLLLIYSANALSATNLAQNDHYLASLSLGPAWVSHLKSHTYNQDTDYEMTYRNHGNPSVTNAELLIGRQKSLTPLILAQMGLTLSKTDTISESGTILEFSNPEFTNFRYRYDIEHTDIGIKGKWILNADLMLDPYVSAGVGVSFNRTKHFSIHPLTDQEYYNPPTTNHHANAFMYTLGVGLQKMIQTNWQLGIGYQFADLGKSCLTVDGNQLNNKSIYLNFLQFNVTYLF
jgi:opacity protein-like surface antigen